MGTALARAQAETDLALRASSYGMPSWAVDGMDVEAVAAAGNRAVETMRASPGPCFLELRTYRFRAHSMYDAERYRDKTEVEHWKQFDPIDKLTARMYDDGELADEAVKKLESEVDSELDDAVSEAQAGPLEPVEDLTRFVYTERP